MDILTQTGSSWKVYPDLTGTSKNLGGLNVSKKVYSAWRTSLYYFFFILKRSDQRNFDFDFNKNHSLSWSIAIQNAVMDFWLKTKLTGSIAELL